MGRVKYLFAIIAFLVPCFAFGQGVNKAVDLSVYSTYRYVYDLTDQADFVFCKVDYLPSGGNQSMQSVTGIEFTNTRPSDTTTVTGVGFQTSNANNPTTVYLMYKRSEDLLYSASQQGRLTFIAGYFESYGLGTDGERQAAFNRAKGINEGSAIPFTPLVAISPQALLAPLAGFVTSGLGIGVSITLLSIFIINLVLNRRKSLARASARENKDIAKETGLSRKRVESLRDDYAVLDRSVKGSMSFRDYAGLEAKEFRRRRRRA